MVEQFMWEVCPAHYPLFLPTSGVCVCESSVVQLGLSQNVSTYHTSPQPITY